MRKHFDEINRKLIKRTRILSIVRDVKTSSRKRFIYFLLRMRKDMTFNFQEQVMLGNFETAKTTTVR